MELPAPHAVSVNVTKALAEMISDAIEKGEASSPDLLRMAFQCASTFRSTDHRGGCNGARILNKPQSDFALNKDLVPAVKKALDSFHARFDLVSYADLIVLAGTVAASKMSKAPFLFCPGRSDVHDGPQSYASQRDRVNMLPPAIHDARNIMTAKPTQLAFDYVKDAARILGVTNAHLSALYGAVGLGVRATSALDNSTVLDNSALRRLGAHRTYAPPKGADVYDMAFLYDPELAARAQDHAADNGLFVSDFTEAWTLMMNADRFEISCDDPKNTIMIDFPTATAGK